MWLELISPVSADPRVLAVVMVLLGGLLLVASQRFGAESGLSSFDPFGLYNRVLSALSLIVLEPARGPGWRGWRRGLPRMPIVPGTAAFFVLLLIGAVTFDGLSATSWYDTAFGTWGGSLIGGSVLLLVTIGLLGLGYWLA